jgi:hypothetical protein
MIIENNSSTNHSIVELSSTIERMILMAERVSRR